MRHAPRATLRHDLGWKCNAYLLTANLTVRALPTLALPFPLEPLATAPPLVGTKADLWLEPEPEATGATSSSLSEMTISSMVDFMILSPREPGREIGRAHV